MGAAATTLKDALESTLRARFIGRERELVTISSWLESAAEREPILVVLGPGGIGKSWLLKRAGSQAAQAGWQVHYADCDQLAGSVADILRALTGEPELAAAVTAFGDKRSLIVLDAAETAPSLGGFLAADLLPLLPAGTRVLIGSRTNPCSHLNEWADAVSLLPLDGFTIDEQELYLRRRGVTEPATIQSIRAHVGGHPLALGLAADLSGSGDRWAGRTKAEWGHGLGELVERLVDPRDADLAELVEAAGLVLRFDEGLLAAMVGRTDIREAYARLCRLSVVKPVRTGLTLHDDIRLLVHDHARWRDPAAQQARQRAALSYLHAQAAEADPAVASRLGGEAVYVVRDMLTTNELPFDETEQGMTVEDLDPQQLRALIENQGWDPADHLSEPLYRALQDLLGLSGTRVNTVRDARGLVRAYGAIVRLSQQNVEMLPTESRIRAALPGLLDRLGLASLPETAEESNVWHYSTGAAPPHDATARAALLRELMTVLSRGGAYLTFPDAEMLAELGPATEFAGIPSEDLDVDASLLEGAAIAAFSDWSRSTMMLTLAAVTHRRPLYRLSEGPALTDEVSTAVAAWQDDDALVSSPLAAALTDPDAPSQERAAFLRRTLLRSLSGRHPIPSLEWRLYRALVEAGIEWLPSVGIARSGVTDRAPVSHRTAPAAEHGSVSVRMQGRFEVRVRGSVAAIGEGVPAAAVKVVALSGKTSTDDLLEALWPETDAETGRARLRTVLARVRRVVPDLLERDHDTIRLGDGVWVDCAAFAERAQSAVQALRRGDPEGTTLGREALATYNGELLPTDRYSDWATGPREQHTRTVLELLDALTAASLDGDDPDAAVAYLERALDIDPYDEQRAVRAVATLAAQGWSLRARAVLARARRAADELGVPLHPRLAELEMKLGPLPGS